MLKTYAQDMYSKGVRNEELLLIKVKPDIQEEITKRDAPGGVTSFFNRDKDGDDKKIENLVEKLKHLTETEEIQQARARFTPNDMLEIWN